MMAKKLYKSKSGSKLSGVCTGLSLYTGIDVTVIRLIFVLLAIFGTTGIIAYIVCAVIMPEEPKDYVDYTYYDKDNQNQ